MINRRKFGRTGLFLSELGLDTASLGWINDAIAAFEQLDAYHEAGGGFVQMVGGCAVAADGTPCSVRSEEIVGQWHRDRGIARDSLVLSTRINFLRPVHGGGVAFANAIRESCEQSLRRLQSGHLDLLVCEWTDDLVPIEDAATAFDMLIRAGLVRHVVAADFPAWRVSDSLHRSTLRNQCRFDGLQTEYSLMIRARFEQEELVMAREHRLGLIARSPLADGFLSASPGSPPWQAMGEGGWLNERFGTNRGDAVKSALSGIVRGRDATTAQVALAWVLRDPLVTSALVSPATAPELLDLIRGVQLALTPDEIEALNAATVERHSQAELRHS